MYLMGKLKSKGLDKSRSRYGERKRTRYAYTFDDREVCRDVFLLTHDIGESYLKYLLKHMNTNGIAPRKHGNCNRRPKNAFSFEEISNIVQYLKNYARLHGLTQAAPPNRHDSELQILLPSCESKQKVKVFGICMEGKGKQYNYLVDEDKGILKDCADTKGPNATISMFDHAIECYGLNEAKYGIHCDNCPGENKNQYMTGYLA
ncbi:unnamed protein product [Mytilus coruscus]|uniref:Uncharacterized protein n=1 Tax=Mytilus coruscus TaxID=42192 RepID=A0A6J8C5Y0_MYTCO|nr:unnamed protein product [Mytilus coruscus]